MPIKRNLIIMDKCRKCEKECKQYAIPGSYIVYCPKFKKKKVFEGK